MSEGAIELSVIIEENPVQLVHISRDLLPIAGRATRIQRAALAVGLGLAVGLASIAFIQRDRADEQSRLSISGQLAAESENLDAADPVTASLLAAASWRIAQTPLAQQSLLDVLAQPERADLTADASIVWDVAFSPDGSLIATASGMAPSGCGVPPRIARSGHRWLPGRRKS